MPSSEPTITESEHGEQVRARLAAATPGPWRADDEHGLMQGAKPAWVVSRTDADDAYLGDLAYIPQDMGVADNQAGPTEKADAELMAHAPADLARLLHRAEQAEAQVARYDALAVDARWLRAKLRQAERAATPPAEPLREGQTL